MKRTTASDNRRNIADCQHVRLGDNVRLPHTFFGDGHFCVRHTDARKPALHDVSASFLLLGSSDQAEGTPCGSMIRDAPH